MSELKKKEFIEKAKEAKDTWICASRDGNGLLNGWFVGFTNGDDDQSVMVTDKKTVRVFKALEAAVSFVAENNLTSYGSVSVAYA